MALSTSTVPLLLTNCVASKKNKSGFVHPGILDGWLDLKRMKTAVNEKGMNPRELGYQKMLSTNNASLDYHPKAFVKTKVTASGSNPEEMHFREDAFAAYADALNWIITGDQRYKNKSIEILNLWADKCKGIFCPTSEWQTTLEASWALPIWLSAAEIIRYYGKGSAGWSKTDQDKFDSFVKMLLHYVGGRIANAPNWHASRALARMAAGVYLNDQSIYNQGYAEAKHQISLIKSAGKPSENARDAGHCQYNVIATSQAAEIAFHQGDNSLYMERHPGESDSVKPLLYRQSEYYVRERMGGSKVPRGGIDYGNYGGARQTPPYEMVLARYKYHFGMPIPYTEQYVIKYARPTGISESHFVGWTTLTHAAVTHSKNG